METRKIVSMQQEQQEKSLFLFVITAGYIITFTVASGGGMRYSTLQLLLGILFGFIYLILVFFEDSILGRFSTHRRNAIFFSIQLALVLGIGWTLGPGGNWLIGLPLAAIAVERLSARWRWLVYVGLLAAIILPILHYSTWDAALMNTFAISAAIFFVDLVTRFRLSEQEARQRAEDLAIQLEAANHRLAEYTLQAEELAATQERNRLAREIHDNLGHYLTAMNVQIEITKVSLDENPRRAQDSLEKAHELVKKALESVRSSVYALHGSSLEHLSLQAAMARLTDETCASGIPAELHVLGQPRIVDEKVALALYRVAQEGMTNVRKHANASQVDFTLDFTQGDKIRLSVRDDGQGAAAMSGGFGLIGIRERVQLLGGQSHIETELGKGFYLEVTIPVGEPGWA